MGVEVSVVGEGVVGDGGVELGVEFVLGCLVGGYVFLLGLCILFVV